MRGEKSTSWEGGFRVPAIFRWKGTIAPGTIDGIGANLDLYATFAKLSGSKDLPDELPGWMSTDLTPTLLSGQPSPRKSWFFSNGVYRSGDYKIHQVTRQPTDPDTRKRRPVTQHDPPLLYNLSSDIGEQNNIAASHPEIVERLLKEMKEAAAKKP